MASFTCSSLFLYKLCGKWRICKEVRKLNVWTHKFSFFSSIKTFIGITQSHNLRVFFLTEAEGSSELCWSKFVRHRRCRHCRCSHDDYINFSHFHLLLQNRWVIFNQTWHKESLGEGDSRLFEWRAPSFAKGDNLEFDKFKILFKNHRANYNQTWHKVSLSEGDWSLFKWRAPPFSKGR